MLRYLMGAINPTSVTKFVLRWRIWFYAGVPRFWLVNSNGASEASACGHAEKCFEQAQRARSMPGLASGASARAQRAIGVGWSKATRTRSVRSEPRGSSAASAAGSYDRAQRERTRHRVARVARHPAKPRWSTSSWRVSTRKASSSSSRQQRR